MRISHAQPSKLTYIDRMTSLSQLGVNQSGVAPHAETVRTQLLLDNSHHARIEASFLEARRATAATTSGIVRLEVQLYTIGVVFRTRISYNDNTVDVFRRAENSAVMVVPISHTIRIVTSDASSGGTNDYVAYLLIWQFFK